MRPTVEEQLDGVQRLLDGVGSDGGLSAASRELLRNAGRLLRHVRGSWSSTLPFLVGDNATMATLLAGLPAGVPGLSADIDAALGTHPGPPDVDVAAVSARNTELRALLARAIRELPRTADGRTARSEIGSYLRQRVETDPT